MCKSSETYRCENLQVITKITGNCTVFGPRSHFVNEISEFPLRFLEIKKGQETNLAQANKICLFDLNLQIVFTKYGNFLVLLVQFIRFSELLG